MEYEDKAEVNQPEKTPFDDIVSRVESYVANPTLATKETLQALLDDLMQMKPYMDEEDEGVAIEGEEKTPAFMASLGSAMRKGGMALAFILLAGSVYADGIFTANKLPVINESNISNICFTTITTITGFVNISTYPAYLFYVNISSPGLGENPQVVISDTISSTGALSARTIDIVDAKSGANRPPDAYNTSTSSGLAVAISGTIAPRVVIGFRQKFTLGD